MSACEPVQQPPQRQASHWLFASVLLGIAALWGLRLVHYTQQSAVDLFAPLAMAVTLGWWAIADSIARERPIPMGTRVWFLLLAGILVPGYFVWTRGWRGALAVVLGAAAWYAVCLLAMFLGRMVAYGVPFGR